MGMHPSFAFPHIPTPMWGTPRDAHSPTAIRALWRDLEHDTAEALIRSAPIGRAVDNAIAVNGQPAVGVSAVWTASEVVDGGEGPTVVRWAQLENIAQSIRAVAPSRAIEIAGTVADDISERSPPAPGRS